jgi:hypothetical protein
VDAAGTLRPADLTAWHGAGFSFTVRALELRYKTKDLLAVQSAGPGQIVRDYTQLPLAKKPSPSELDRYGIDVSQYRQIDGRLINFAESIAGGQADAVPPGIYDKVRNIYDYLNDPNEFEYTRDYVEIAGDKEFTSQFVFAEKKQGHCRYFASTMAVFCRINGIPARVVSGYRPGEFSIVDNAYVYRASDAHAWVEIYFDGFGWLLFDPTPAGEQAEDGNPLVRTFRSVVDFLQDLFVLDPAATQKLLLSFLANCWLLIRQHWALSLAFVGLLSTLFLAYRHWLRQAPRQRRVELKPENLVVEAYLAVLSQLRRLGLPLEQGMTARQAFALASHYHDSISEPLRKLLPLYERAAFGASAPHDDAGSSAQQVAAEVETAVRSHLEELRRQRSGGPR